ncbi:MAG: biotin-dependent carboxyltransferase, partial [Clostridiales bacterium]|nr:biotin-dependent carboxyltransferase [Clostridiales bacterium]
MEVLKIISKGMLSTIQDNGRATYRKYGVPTSGALDTYAMACANLALGNDESTPVVEITYGAFKCEFLCDTTIVITGGDLAACINGETIRMWETLSVKAGDILEFKGNDKGFRAYLAVHSGFDYPIILGSASVFTRAGFNSYLKDGDVLCMKSDCAHDIKAKIVPNEMRPIYDNIIHVTEGPHGEYFSNGYAQLLNTEYVVDNSMDRMGIRLSGKALQCADKSLLSCPIPVGSVQMPPSGQPIITLADGQVTGGYP